MKEEEGRNIPLIIMLFDPYARKQRGTKETLDKSESGE